MASNPTKAELAGELDARLQAVESEFKTFQAVAAFRASIWERTVSDQAQAVAGLLQQNAAQEERIKVLERSSDHPATLSAHEQRLKVLEKGTDRVWQLLPVAVSAVALLLAAYVAFVKK